MTLEERIVLLVSAGGVGVLLALAVIYVVTYRPMKDPSQSVSTAWLDDQLRGRRN